MPRTDRGASTTIIIICVALILAALIAVVVMRQHNAVSKPSLAAVQRPALSLEQKAYLDSILFQDFRMTAADNFLGGTVTYLDGTVANNGAKAVSRLNVELNFLDSLNQVVLRENTNPLAGRTTPLPPGGTQAFRVSFDHMPMDWNQAPPLAKAVGVEF